MNGISALKRDLRDEGCGVMNWEIGIDMYTLMCIKWMTNKKNKQTNKQKRLQSSLSPLPMCGHKQKRALTWPCWFPDLQAGCPAFKTVKSRFPPCTSHSACGILLWQPGQIKTPEKLSQAR